MNKLKLKKKYLKFKVRKIRKIIFYFTAYTYSSTLTCRLIYDFIITSKSAVFIHNKKNTTIYQLLKLVATEMFVKTLEISQEFMSTCPQIKKCISFE